MTNGWYTTSEMEQEYGINKRLAYTWFSLLEGEGLARRAHGGKHGVLLFNPEGARYLWRRGKRPGKPCQKLRIEEQEELAQAIYKGASAEQIAVYFGTTVTTAKKWLASQQRERVEA